MKTHIALASALTVIATSVASSVAMAAPDYAAICRNGSLTRTERADCKAQMKAADTVAAKAVVFKAFDLKIAGFAPDGSRLSAKDKTVQEASK